MQIHNIPRPKSKRRAKLIGRGGKRGTTAGRGTKGQKARAGHRIRPQVRDTIISLPKKRGYKVSAGRRQLKPAIINLKDLEQYWLTDQPVTKAALIKARLISRLASKNGVKILGQGQLTKKITISDCQVSKTAAQKVTQAGGTVRT